MNKKGTLQVCLSGAWGGLEMVVYEHAMKIRQHGGFVTTVCPPGSPLQNKLVEAGLPTIGVAKHRRYWQPHIVRVIRQALKTGQYSVVLVQQTFDLWQVVPALWRMPKIRLVCISHSFLGVSKRDFLHQLLYGRCDVVVALNENHRRNLLQRLPLAEQKIEILVNSVDPEKFKPANRSEAIRKQYIKTPGQMLIGVVARIEKGKGVMDAVKVADRLREFKLPFQLVFFGKETIGEEGHKQEMEDEIRKRNLRDFVQFAGHRTDIEHVIASLDVLLMPSPAETFGRVIIEAMASGTPVVASGGGGVSSIVRHHVDGILAGPHNIEEMADGIRFIYDYPDKRKKMAENGLTAAKETFDYRVVDQKLYDILGL
jgi:glycosyltransferase involved in cell wall biosynthesis